MKPTGIQQSFDMGDGRMVTIETGKLAKQADGSVVVKYGNTMLLATAVSNPDAKPGVDFMPLTVDYREMFASTGRFPGGFFKREARPSDSEVLVSRLVDRALRPLFPEDYHADTQVLIYLISSDKTILPDCFAGLAAAAALAVSDIPFNGPISEVRVGRIDGNFIINPNMEEMKRSDIDMIVAASQKDILMVEGEMLEVSEEVMLEAIKFAHEAIRVQIGAINALAAEVEKSKVKREYSHETNDAALQEKVHAFCYDKALAVAMQGNPNKAERKAGFKAVFEAFWATIPAEEQTDELKGLAKKYYYITEWEAVRRAVLDTRKRLDGRGLTDIRPIWCETDYLPMAHGSSVFTRGETQSLTTVTLGTKLDAQLLDTPMFNEEINFLLHYNFPPFSTGEAKPMRGTGRREIGHGNLALRALKNMIPADNQYTIRIVSDILESNGSSSMATVCAGTMALMDAGVKIKKPVAGIAMGLITDNTGKYAVLSDILGDEDHLGDMDFKVCGTADGITAVQMDLKVDGLPYEVMAQALQQAKQGRLHIMGEMMKTISEARDDFKAHAPRIVQLRIPREFIGAVIGPGGKIIQEMQRETGTTIMIEEVGEFGVVDIAASNKDSIDKAVMRIKGITSLPDVGEVYEGKVKSIMPFGAFVEFLPGRDGLLHISEVDWKRLESLDGILKQGDILQVKLIEIDEKTGKFRLSRKVLLPKPEGWQERPPRREGGNNNRGPRNPQHESTTQD
ncbi:MAG: polyribonucleotide nucleotidyltransferase [Bacteroidia bacterium]|jgi:polyribonucleotide nucleotidyltransferase|nr:polyribonucleotide nucleotidyltransferase [Bacteroidia bacterium]